MTMVAHATPDLERVARCAAEHADDVDRRSRFPEEAVAALRAERLLSAAIPRELGGLGLDIDALTEVATRLAQSCASTAMIWAMHQIQVACLVRHGVSEPFFADYVRAAADAQWLLASVTSEVGVGGDIRTSVAAVEPVDLHARLRKHGSTISYGAHADAYLVTARRSPDAANQDQVLVLLPRSQTHVEQTGTWDMLGMRGTCSPSFLIDAQFERAQILPVPFADICALTMVPYSHILWSACWLGIATDAVKRARACVRKKTGGAADLRLADAANVLHEFRSIVRQAARSYGEALQESDDARLLGFGFAVEMNQLKMIASDLVIRAVAHALAICGMAGYSAQGPHSVARHLRDAYSAGCMISNERLRAANAEMLLIQKAL